MHSAVPCANLLLISISVFFKTSNFQGMKTRFRFPLILLLALIASAQFSPQLSAQDNKERGAYIGLHYGRSISQVSTDQLGHVIFEALETSMKRRSGAQFGVYFGFPIGSYLAIQPEINFVPKGADFNLKEPTSYPGDNLEESPSSASIGLAMSYLEVPILARIDFLPSSSVRPYILGGPSASLRAACTYKLDVGRTRMDINCDGSDESATGVGDIDDYFSRFDMGITGGAGLAFRFFGLPLAVEGRWSTGLKTVLKESDLLDARNQTITVLFSLGR